MSERLTIQSHMGAYSVVFEDDVFSHLHSQVPSGAHFIIDARIAHLYAQDLANVFASPSVLRVDATEANKSLNRLGDYVEHLISQGVRRGHVLIAIGGGIIQDITCFLGGTLFRGVEWHFYPTTLLAQSDSCIGSKSSINVGTTKNVLGTFTPPRYVGISVRVLDTLTDADIRSGLGEMLKVHVIEGPESFDQIAGDYVAILKDRAVMRHYIYRSLQIKKAIIEQDEFDHGLRNILNYGHSFGHAIESATDFAVPHGIAVTIGMDMANYISVQLGLMDGRHYDRMHPTLAANYSGYEAIAVPLARFLTALRRDKKNRNSALGLILPDADAHVSLGQFAADSKFESICADYLTYGRRA